MRSSTLCILFALGPVAAASAQRPAPLGETSSRTGAITNDIDATVRRLAPDGSGAVVGDGAMRCGEFVHRGFDPAAALPIGRASRWFATAVVLAMVERGELDLDLPVSRYVDEFARDDKRRLTLRQCLSCTAGFGTDLDAARDRRLDLDGLARALAAAPLRNDPGLEFVDSDLGYAVAMVAAARRAQRDWHALFRQHVARPLGLEATRFGRMHPPGADAGTIAVPWPGSGAVSSLRDCERLVRMLARRGLGDDGRVLGAASVEAMLRPQTQRTTVRLPGIDDPGYGLGAFVHRSDEGALVATTTNGPDWVLWFEPGGTWGVVGTRRGNARNVPLPELQQAARDLAAAPEFAGTTEVVVLQHGGRDRRYLLHLPPGAERSPGMPLVIALHAEGASAQELAAATPWFPLAARTGFAVAVPDGTGPQRGRALGWNTGSGYPAQHRVDDVDFLREVAADAARRVAIDPTRVVGVGHGEGGAMLRLVLEQERFVRAIAIVDEQGAVLGQRLPPAAGIEPASPLPIDLAQVEPSEHAAAILAWLTARPAR